MVGIAGMLPKQAFGAQKWWFLQVLVSVFVEREKVMNFEEEDEVKAAGKRKRNKGK